MTQSLCRYPTFHLVEQSRHPVILDLLAALLVGACAAFLMLVISWVLIESLQEADQIIIGFAMMAIFLTIASTLVGAMVTWYGGINLWPIKALLSCPGLHLIVQLIPFKGVSGIAKPLSGIAILISLIFTVGGVIIASRMKTKDIRRRKGGQE